MQQRVYIVQTPVRDTSRCDQPWSSASLTHGQAYHKTSSTKQLVNAESDYVQAWGKRTSLWTSANITPALFRASTRHHLLYSEPPTVYRGKHVVSRYLRRSHLKANEVSKGEGTMKVKYAYHFQKCADAVDWKLSKLIYACRSYSLPKKLARFLRRGWECSACSRFMVVPLSVHLSDSGNINCISPLSSTQTNRQLKQTE